MGDAEEAVVRHFLEVCLANNIESTLVYNTPRTYLR